MVGILSFSLLLLNVRYAILRILCLLFLLLIFSNPHIKHEQRVPMKNIVLLLIDESASQSLSNRPELIKQSREEIIQSLQNIKNIEVRIASTKPYQKNKNSRTELYAALKKEIQNIPANLLSGVFILTDGQSHDIPKNLKHLDINVPIHALITGHSKEIDQRIEIVQAPRFGIVGSNANIQVKVMRDGATQNASDTAVVKITAENKKSKKITVPIGQTVNIPMRFRHSGANFVEIEVEKLPNELTEVNNKTAIVAEGVRENLRVLLVSGEPHAGERTWRNLLKSDASVDLVHFTILRPPEKQDGTPINQLSLIAFPTRELFSEKLNQFDLVIFDRYRRRGVLPLLYLDNIARYVEQGGAILIAAGKLFSSPLSIYRTPLAEVLPAAPTGRVIEEPYRARVTEAGRRHPVTQNLPGDNETKPTWGRWFRLIQVEQKKGDILMNGPDKNPLLMLDRLGKGRVALLLSDHAWLWARGFDGGGPHTTLLRRLAHWLMKEPDLEEEYLSAKNDGQFLTIERRTMKETASPVTVQFPDGSKEQIELNQVSPGVWQKQVQTNLSGLYRFNSDKLTASTHFGPVNSIEMTHVAATDKLLKPLVEKTGGRSFWLQNKESVTDSQNLNLPKITVLRNSRLMHGRDWAAIRKRNAYKVEGITHIPAFTGIVTLLLLSLLIALTWFRESR